MNQVDAREWDLRVQVAACYRLIAAFGWSDLVFTHVSARIPGKPHQFLINPYGLMFDEITASSLVKVDSQGQKLVDSPYPVNPAGFMIHSSIHTHTRAGSAVSAQQCGVLPVSQQSTFVLSSLAYHAYEGVADDFEERARLQSDLGQARFLVLRNHGLLTLAEGVPDAFLSMYIFETACQIQIAAQCSTLSYIAPAVLERVARQPKISRGSLDGEFVWPALLRKLDRLDPSYRN